MPKPATVSPIIQNRRAAHDYEFVEVFEAGIELTGSEVKSLRGGKASLDGAYATVRGGEVWLRDCDIQPYPMAGYAQHKPKRERRLLLHRGEIRKLADKVTLRGLTLVPLRIFFNERGFAKVAIALARGRKVHDKRDAIKQRDMNRDADRTRRRGR